jgi:NAD(P)H-flavin reductase/ferredoxin
MHAVEAAHEGRGISVCLEFDGRSFDCMPGQTVLAAALAAGVDLPYACASGSCGSCRARLIEGAVASRWVDAPGLSERDRRKGDRILCCQSVPQTNCVIQVRAGDAVPPAPPRSTRAEVRSVSLLNNDVVHLVVDAQDRVAFLPGQFMLLDLQDGFGRRAYSMANLANDAGRLEFIVKRKLGGQASKVIFERLSAGDRLALEGPYGRAWLRDDSARDIVLLAGGSGIAPIWSIAQGALLRSPRRRLRLYFGVNRHEDLFWLTQMEQARRAYPGLEVHFVLMHASAADPPGCRHGTVGAVLSGDVHDLSLSDIYVAGPPGLVDHALSELVATGRAQADRVFFDRFC